MLNKDLHKTTPVPKASPELQHEHEAVRQLLDNPAFCSAMEVFIRDNLKLELSLDYDNYWMLTVQAKIKLKNKVICTETKSTYVRS